MKYQAVLFDMDGTVLDTLDDLCDSINHSLAEFSLPPVSREHVRQCLGNGAAFLVSHSIPSDSGPELEANVLAFYKPWYDAHCLIKTAPYEGILPMMQSLKEHGLRLAIISNKPDRAVQEPEKRGWKLRPPTVFRSWLLKKEIRSGQPPTV